MRWLVGLIYVTAWFGVWIKPAGLSPSYLTLLAPVGNTQPLRNQGFEVGGVYPYVDSSGVPENLITRGSWVGSDANTGTYDSPWYPIKKGLLLLVCGYPNHPLNTLAIEFRNPRYVSTIVRFPEGDPHETWKKWEPRVPSDAKLFQIHAVDGDPGPGGWVGFSDPYTQSALTYIGSRLAVLCLLLTIVTGPGLISLAYTRDRHRSVTGAYLLGPALLGSMATFALLGSKLVPVLVSLRLTGSATLVGILAYFLWAGDYGQICDWLRPRRISDYIDRFFEHASVFGTGVARSNSVRCALLVTGCVGLMYYRRPDAFLRPQFWAEDGNFYRDAMNDGGNAIFTSYAGYLHLLPRLTAAIAAALDPHWAPTIFLSVACTLTLYSIYMAWNLLKPYTLGALAAAMILLVPDSSEVVCNIVNIQWVVAPVLVVLALGMGEKNGISQIHRFVAVVIIGLTGPFAILSLPLFVFRFVAQKTRFALRLLVAASACAGIQLFFILTHPIESGAPSILRAMVSIPVIVGQRIGAHLLLPLCDEEWTQSEYNLIGMFTIAVTLGIVFLPNYQRRLRFGLATASVFIFAGSLYRTRGMLDALTLAHYGDRYFYILQLLLLWLLLLAMSNTRGIVRNILRFALFSFLLGDIARLRIPELPDRHWAASADRISAGETVTAEINPGDWQIVIRGPRK